MRKIDIGHTITILANLGVIGGIIFLGLEINQNTRSQELAAYQDLLGQIARISELIIENPNIWNLPRTKNLEDLTPEELAQVRQLAILIFRHGDSAYNFRERDVISADELQSATNILRVNICDAHMLTLWNDQLREGFRTTYRNYVESVIRDC